MEFATGLEDKRALFHKRPKGFGSKIKPQHTGVIELVFINLRIFVSKEIPRCNLYSPRNDHSPENPYLKPEEQLHFGGLWSLYEWRACCLSCRSSLFRGRQLRGFYKSKYSQKQLECLIDQNYYFLICVKSVWSVFGQIRYIIHIV